MKAAPSDPMPCWSRHRGIGLAHLYRDRVLGVAYAACGAAAQLTCLLVSDDAAPRCKRCLKIHSQPSKTKES